MGDFKPIRFNFDFDYNVNQNRCSVVSQQLPKSTNIPLWNMPAIVLPEKKSIGEMLIVQQKPSATRKPSIPAKTENIEAPNPIQTPQIQTKNCVNEYNKEINALLSEILDELKQEIYTSHPAGKSSLKIADEIQNLPQIDETLSDLVKNEDGTTTVFSEGNDEKNGIKRSSTSTKLAANHKPKSWRREIEYTDGRKEIFFYEEGKNQDGTINEAVIGKWTSYKDENGQEYWTRETTSRDKNTGHFIISKTTDYDEAEFSGGWDTFDAAGNPTGRCNVHGYGNVGKRDYGYNDAEGTFHTKTSLIYVNDIGFMPTEDFTTATGWNEENPPSIQIQISLTDEKDMAEQGNHRFFETNLGKGEEYIREETTQDINGQAITVRVHGYTITDVNGEIVQEYREIYDKNREYLLQTEEHGRNAFVGTDISNGKPITKYRHFTVINEYNCKAGTALRIPQNTYTQQGILGEVIRTTNSETGEDTVTFGKKGTPYDCGTIAQSLQLS